MWLVVDTVGSCTRDMSKGNTVAYSRNRSDVNIVHINSAHGFRSQYGRRKKLAPCGWRWCFILSIYITLHYLTGLSITHFTPRWLLQTVRKFPLSLYQHWRDKWRNKLIRNQLVKCSRNRSDVNTVHMNSVHGFRKKPAACGWRLCFILSI